MLLPLIMVGFGRLWRYHPPKKINYMYGYRTRRSMASQQAWDLAHKIMGRIWFVSGIGLTLITLGFLLLFPDFERYSTEYLVFSGFQLFVMMSGIPLTEKQLKKLEE